MSQDKTAVPGLGEESSSTNKKNRNFYSRASTQVNYDFDNRGTIVPGMEQRAPGVNLNESSDGKTSPVVGFLYSISRQGIGEYWPIHLGRNTIGRAESCDICLREHTISDLHAVLNVKQMKTTHKVLASIKDEGSKNGIFVNEEELDYSTHECFNNDLITIGLNYRLLLILIDTEALGLTVSENFIPVDAEEEEFIPYKQKNDNQKGAGFNPYDHNNRPLNSGTVAMDGSHDMEPGSTKFM